MRNLPFSKLGTVTGTLITERITELSMTHENNTNASSPEKIKTAKRENEKEEETKSFVYSEEAPVNEEAVNKKLYPTFCKGKYELIKLIGSGMTSKVFMVRLAANHSQIYALKVITNDYWNKRQDYILNEIEVLK